MNEARLKELAERFNIKLHPLWILSTPDDNSWLREQIMRTNSKATKPVFWEAKKYFDL